MSFIQSTFKLPLARKAMAAALGCALIGTTLVAGATDASAYYRRVGIGHGYGGGYRHFGGYRRFGYHGGYHRGFGPGAIVAGAIGALAVGAIAANAYPRYGYAGPGPVYGGPGDCYIQRRRFWNGDGYFVRNVRVCD